MAIHFFLAVTIISSCSELQSQKWEAIAGGIAPTIPRKSAAQLSNIRLTVASQFYFFFLQGIYVWKWNYLRTWLLSLSGVHSVRRPAVEHHKDRVFNATAKRALKAQPLWCSAAGHLTKLVHVSFPEKYRSQHSDKSDMRLWKFFSFFFEFLVIYCGIFLSARRRRYNGTICKISVSVRSRMFFKLKLKLRLLMICLEPSGVSTHGFQEVPK